MNRFAEDRVDVGHGRGYPINRFEEDRGKCESRRILSAMLLTLHLLVNLHSVYVCSILNDKILPAREGKAGGRHFVCHTHWLSNRKFTASARVCLADGARRASYCHHRHPTAPSPPEASHT